MSNKTKISILMYSVIQLFCLSFFVFKVSATMMQGSLTGNLESYLSTNHGSNIYTTGSTIDLGVFIYNNTATNKTYYFPDGTIDIDNISDLDYWKNNYAFFSDATYIPSTFVRYLFDEFRREYDWLYSSNVLYNFTDDLLILSQSYKYDIISLIYSETTDYESAYISFDTSENTSDSVRFRNLVFTSTPINTVPESSTIFLLGLGLILFVGANRIKLKESVL